MTQKRWIQQHQERNASAAVIRPAFFESLWEKLSQTPDLKPDDIKPLCMRLSFDSGKSEQVIALNILFDIRSGKTVDSTGCSQTPDSNAKNRFINYLQEIPISIDSMKVIAHGERLNCHNIFPQIADLPEYSDEQLDNLEAFMQDPIAKYSGSVTVLHNQHNRTLSTDAEHAHKNYCMASVGKVLTGVLTLTMAHDHVFEDTDLKKIGVHIPEHIIDCFPANCREQVKRRLSEISLHDLMLHTSGFGDCFGDPSSGGYFAHIAKLTKEQKVIPKINDPNDLFNFADEKTNALTPVGKFRYSNVGMMLLGAAIQHLYNQKHHSNFSYHEILEKELLNPAGVKVFEHRPENDSCYAKGDIFGENLVGNAAGGYWSKTEEMAKFGDYVRTQLYLPSERMQKLFSDYGQEFFDDHLKEISHRGDTPNGGAMFNVSMRTGTIWVGFADTGGGAAADLHNVCRERLEHDRQTAAQSNQLSAKNLHSQSLLTKI
jgi:CubicO group peptidase (beta-lactamase class C family)